MQRLILGLFQSIEIEVGEKCFGMSLLGPALDIGLFS